MTRTKRALSADKRTWSPSLLPGQVVLVSTCDANGEPSVATRSWVSMAAFGPPPMLSFGCNLGQTTFRHLDTVPELVVNIPGVELAEAAWVAGSGTAGDGRARFDRCGLTPFPSERVRPPRIAECRAHLECEVDSMRVLDPEVVVFARIVAASIDADLCDDDADGPARYEALSPFFFLEGGLAAGLGRPFRPAEPRHGDGQADHELTILAVSDLQRATAFYGGAFGWPVRVAVPVYVEFGLPGGRGLGLYLRGGFERNTGSEAIGAPGDKTTATELYLRVTDLGAAIERVSAAGGRPLSGRSLRPWGDEAAYYQDPDGNVVVVARRAGG